MLTTSLVLQLLLIGAAAGLLAGLLGVGGGLILVPAMVSVFECYHIGGVYLQHLAVGTSLLVMVFTSMSSIVAHHRNHAVDWYVMRRMAPALMIGALVGSQVAKEVSSSALKWFFIVYAYCVALQLLCNFKLAIRQSLPKTAGLWGISSGIGFISSLVGIGGGSMNVPFLSGCNIPLPRAIATSAALGWPISVAGAVGYWVMGWSAPGLPSGALGFVYLPAAFVLLLATMVVTPVGAKLTHTLPVPLLRKIFAILMIVAASMMVLNVYGGVVKNGI